jgi:hypothetical protein
VTEAASSTSARPPALQTGPRARTRLAVRRAHKALGDHPAALPVVLRLTPLGTARRIHDGTQLVIEGFPRSGNTFAVFALRLAQPAPVDVTSHVHVPAQVKVAVRRGLPTLLCVREPVGTTTSLVIAAPHLPVDRALKEYVHHHRQLVPLLDRCLVADFEQITADMGLVTEAVNERFGTTFVPFDHTPEHEAEVFAAIDVHHQELHGGTEHVVARPSDERRAEQARLRELLASPGLAGLLEEAKGTYAEVRAGS